MIDTLSQRYFYLDLPDHLAEANELAVSGSAWALIADYDRNSASELQTLIGRTLRLSAGVCARDRCQLIPQLLGHLMTCEGAKHFLDMARHHLSRPSIVTA